MTLRTSTIALVLGLFVVAQTYEACPTTPPGGGGGGGEDPPPEPGAILLGPGYQDVIDGVENVNALSNNTNRTDLYHTWRMVHAALIADEGVTAMENAGFELALTEQQYCDLADASYEAELARMNVGTDGHGTWDTGYPNPKFLPPALFRIWCDAYLTTERQAEIEADFVAKLQSLYGSTVPNWQTSIPWVGQQQHINNRGVEDVGPLVLALAIEDPENAWRVFAENVFTQRIVQFEMDAYLGDGAWHMESLTDYMGDTFSFLPMVYKFFFPEMIDGTDDEPFFTDLPVFLADIYTGTRWFNFGTTTANVQLLGRHCRPLSTAALIPTTGAAASFLYDAANCDSTVLLDNTGLWGNWHWIWHRAADGTWIPREDPSELGEGQRQHGNGWFTSDAGDKVHIFAKRVDGYGHDSNTAGATYIVHEDGRILIGQQTGNKNGIRRYTSSHGRHHGINVSCRAGTALFFADYGGWSDVAGPPAAWNLETVGVVQEVDTSNAAWLYHRYGRQFGGSDSQGAPGLIQEIVHLYDERIVVGRYTYGTLNCTPVFLAHIAEQPGETFPTSTIGVWGAQLDTSEPLDNYWDDMQTAEPTTGNYIGGQFGFVEDGNPDCRLYMCGSVRSYGISSGFMWVAQLADSKETVTFDGATASIGDIDVTLDGDEAIVSGLP